MIFVGKTTEFTHGWVIRNDPNERNPHNDT
jgi:hypothetical protein